MKTFFVIIGTVAFFVLFFLWSSWSATETFYYVYGSQVVKRVDTPGRSTFYYLTGDKKITKTWAKYSGINAGFASYLVFQVVAIMEAQLKRISRSVLAIIFTWMFMFCISTDTSCFIFGSESAVSKKAHVLNHGLPGG